MGLSINTKVHFRLKSSWLDLVRSDSLVYAHILTVRRTMFRGWPPVFIPLLSVKADPTLSCMVLTDTNSREKC